jgi:predicted ATPase
MTDPRKTLSRKYEQSNRYSNFGPVIRKMTITGFRGLNNFEISFDYPVTAISALNGMGKSTIGHIALCGYSKPSEASGYTRSYYKDYFPVSTLDPRPISDIASVVYEYETNDRDTPQVLTVRRRDRKWEGYKRQPSRFCYYGGFSLYIPKVERRDISVYRGSHLEIVEESEFSHEVQTSIRAILKRNYSKITTVRVRSKSRQADISVIHREDRVYSENNMGFGEARIIHLVSLLENSPEQSLFVLEEPETALHENAEYELAKYLIDVCSRRHHQIILSTHSSTILKALPSPARKLIISTHSGIDCVNGASVAETKSILSEGRSRDIVICVEDEFAKELVRAILRSTSRELVKTVTIEALGDKDAVGDFVRKIHPSNRRVIGIRDGDVGESPDDGLFSLPGSRAPELEVFENPSVIEHLNCKYQANISDIITLSAEANHHSWPEIIAAELELTVPVVINDAIVKYVDLLDNAEKEKVASIIRQVGDG